MLPSRETYTDAQRRFLASSAIECAEHARKLDAAGNKEDAEHFRRVAANLREDAKPIA
jgi:hypothetical protein